MSQKIFEEWQRLSSQPKLDARAINNLYEREGEDLLARIDADAGLSQGWESTFALTSDVVAGLLRLFASGKEIKILDVGAGGNPRLFLSLANRAGNGQLKYFATDISASKLKAFDVVARRKGAGSGFCLACLDCGNISFKDEAFDLVVCDDTIEHLTEPARALKEIKRILKKKGLLILSTPNRRRPDALIRKIMDTFRRKKICRSNYYMAVSHLREFSHCELKTLLESCGLTIKRTFILNYAFSLAEIKTAGYFTYIPDFILVLPYTLLNFFIRLSRWKTLSTHIFVLCCRQE